MKKILAMTTLAFAAMSANATVVYNNPYNSTSLGGNCVFNTTCGPTAGGTDAYAAQQFTLSSATTLQSASFTMADIGGQATAVNWEILSIGINGLPGSILAQGSDAAIISTQNLSVVNNGYSIDQDFFNISATLASGSYYFGLQEVTSEFHNYLLNGTQGSVAAESLNNVNWDLLGHYYSKSIAISLSDTPVGAAVPEPSSIALFAIALAGLAAVFRQRNRA